METSKIYWQSTHEAISKPTRTILNEYLLSLKLANKDEATIVKYRWIVERFFSECTVNIEMLTANDIFIWLNEANTDKTEKTVDLYLSAVSSFFKFFLRRGYLENSNLKSYWLGTKLNKMEYASIRLAMESISLRDRALTLLLFSSGCRSSEISNLLIQDINLEQMTGKIKRKGVRNSNLYFSKECADVLKAYLKTRSGDCGEPLFLNRLGRRLQTYTINEITKNLGKKAGLKQTLHPRCFRNNFTLNEFKIQANREFIPVEMVPYNFCPYIYTRLSTKNNLPIKNNKSKISRSFL